MYTLILDLFQTFHNTFSLSWFAFKHFYILSVPSSSSLSLHCHHLFCLFSLFFTNYTNSTSLIFIHFGSSCSFQWIFDSFISFSSIICEHLFRFLSSSASLDLVVPFQDVQQYLSHYILTVMDAILNQQTISLLSDFERERFYPKTTSHRLSSILHLLLRSTLISIIKKWINKNATFDHYT